MYSLTRNQFKNSSATIKIKQIMFNMQIFPKKSNKV